MKDNVVETETQVLIVGGGPIGLMGSLLLSRLGVRSLVVDLRGRTSTHPRSRLLDAPSVELMREVGVEQQVIDTGLGPDWTEYNRWFDCLAGKEICRVPTPSFHSVRTDRSSSMPVMTAQDHVEAILYDQAAGDPNVDLRFDTTASQLTQDDAGVSCTIRDNRSGDAILVSAEFAIGADGLRSSTRAAIGTTLEADFMDVFFQDVIFEADFSSHTSDRQGGLLFIAHPMGNAVFQPLDGVRRWRCQIGGFDRTQKMTAEFAENWIRSALGANDPAPIEVRTMTEWQFPRGRRHGSGRPELPSVRGVRGADLQLRVDVGTLRTRRRARAGGGESRLRLRAGRAVRAAGAEPVAGRELDAFRPRLERSGLHRRAGRARGLRGVAGRGRSAREKRVSHSD